MVPRGCRLCARKNLDTLYCSQRYLFEVVRCLECGLVFVQDPPSESVLEKMYSDEASFNRFQELIHNEKVFSRHQRTLAEILALLKLSKCSTDSKKYRLLDIGAGSGSFLNKAREAGFEIYGNELSEAAIQYSLKKYNVRLDSGDVGRDPRTEFFDAITMWGVLEHVREPMSLLSTAARLLKQDGVFYIYTPIWCLYD
jgi:2-polyprenyl-3-methyl-5-hydroxy-6-metoxy-1,4-benzoquinol methylase